MTTPDQSREPLWRISGNDLHEHGFDTIGAGRDAAEALCGHCVPAGRLTVAAQGGMSVPKCLACLLIHGDRLADLHEERDRWT